MSETPKRRRFLPEPIEVSSRSSKNNHTDPPAKQHSHPKNLSSQSPESDLNRYPRPWLDNTAFPRSKGQKMKPQREPQDVKDRHLAPRLLQTTPMTLKDELKQDGPRKFTPQLMETARHSFRRGRKAFTIDSSPELETRDLDLPHTHTDTSIDVPLDSTHGIHESRFSYSSLLRRQESRRHSFRVPDLPAIPSSCSEGSDESNIPNPGFSPLSVPSHVPERRQNTNKRQGFAHDRRLADYVSPLPVHPSENQLKEQALAAFPNEQVYQPVHHFAIDREEEDWTYGEDNVLRYERPELRASRRASSTDLHWELEYLRRHKEKVGARDRYTPGMRGARFSSAARRASRSIDKFATSNEKRDRDRELTRLKRTSPPMLGDDLVFPQSSTPQTTICEETHPVGSNECRYIFPGFPGLWSADPHHSTKHDAGGLWMGTCKIERSSAHSGDSLLPGIVTPIHDIPGDTWKCPNGISAVRHSNQHLTVRTKGSHITSSQNEGCEPEFNDGFVTQIYNYLSLGYPSVARYYDYELSKVSGVPIAALRGNDLNTDAKGHVGVQDTTNDDAANGACMRWVALRLYIREWVRQQPGMVDSASYHDTWGVRERKGSWAF
ncbi:hypothetical protein P175DRAFT_0429396 [Aspergillus ochraceoroseus IBT 24754]|uniref:Uncharacterized protein n=1 Tax=Aspergillus ochraceoroseus IBT 24754 TaxID=1392256 RepID=A0A2T5M5E4_9EURO|nr:uncharacterized protein P175DRAFT_0429396 [Aspergillus ochraceoroseus IBT 24754]PTU23761.1 hypothetical protein P175DRAFT_0429396 [Aspergillus ochraceoroseus IBT 24754]